METWAHSLDVFEALGVTVAPTDRIGHVAHIGVRTRNFSFAANELAPPADEFRIELTSPSGALWAYGPVDRSEEHTSELQSLMRIYSAGLCLKITKPTPSTNNSYVHPD